MPRRKRQPEPAPTDDGKPPLPERRWRNWRRKTEVPFHTHGLQSVRNERTLYGVALLRRVMQLSDQVDVDRLCQDAAEYIIEIWEHRPRHLYFDVYEGPGRPTT
jgi:hypothetical protein